MNPGTKRRGRFYLDTRIPFAMATASGAALSSAEAETLKLALEYLVNSMDTSSLLPAALSRGIIREQQRAECTSVSNLSDTCQMHYTSWSTVLILVLVKLISSMTCARQKCGTFSCHHLLLFADTRGISTAFYTG